MTTVTDTVLAAPSRPASPNRSGRGRPRLLSAGAFLLPNLLLSGLFLVIPLILAVVYSFQRLDRFGDSQWLAFNNYADLFADPVFYESLLNTVIFTVCTVPVGMALGLGIAVLLNSVLPLRALWRSIVFVPLVISSVSTGLLGAWMFDENNGFVNNLLAELGIGSAPWQTSGGWAMASVILVTLWQRVGFDMIIYLAGLQGVDPDLDEAAALDGANAWQRFWRVTFPLLGPSTFFLLIMNLIYSFQVFDTVYAMTAGGPNYSTTMLVTYAYRVGFDEHGNQELGYAATVGVVVFVITLLITTGQWRWNKRRDEVA